MRIVALFNLKSGASIDSYEAWARSRGLPAIRSLVSVHDFNVYRTTGVLFSQATPAFDYIEILDVASVDGFVADCDGSVIRQLRQEMSEFADDLALMTTEALVEG